MKSNAFDLDHHIKLFYNVGLAWLEWPDDLGCG